MARGRVQVFRTIGLKRGAERWFAACTDCKAWKEHVAWFQAMRWADKHARTEHKP